MPFDHESTTAPATAESNSSPANGSLRLYAVRLDNGRSSTARFAVYRMDASGDLVPLWADTNHTPMRPLFPHQTITKRRELPAAHFAIRGYGFSKTAELAASLARHFRQDVALHVLHGWLPSVETGRYEGDQ
jgi:hypothetical protein